MEQTDTATNMTTGLAAGDEATASAALREKLIDALTPGYQVELAPDEAERIGAFFEDALSEQDAIDSIVDLVGIVHPGGAAPVARGGEDRS